MISPGLPQRSKQFLGGGIFLSHSLGDFLFAEQDLQETELGLDLFIFLIFLLHGGAILFLTDSVGKHKSVGA